MQSLKFVATMPCTVKKIHHECRSKHVTPLQPKSAFMILFVQGVFWLFGKRAEKKHRGSKRLHPGNL